MRLYREIIAVLKKVAGKERIDALEEKIDMVEALCHLFRYRMASVFFGSNTYRILDVGCGFGYGARIVSCSYSDRLVTAFDISKSAIKYARSKYHENVDYLLADAQCMPFADEIFDGVICFELIEHVRNDYLVLHEICRVLKAGGRLALSVPHKRHLFAQLMCTAEKPRQLNPYHFNEYAIPEFISLLKKNNFNTLEYFGLLIPDLPPVHFIPVKTFARFLVDLGRRRLDKARYLIFLAEKMINYKQ